MTFGSLNGYSLFRYRDSAVVSVSCLVCWTRILLSGVMIVK